MQIKTTMRYHFTPVRMAKINNIGTTGVGVDVERGEASYTAGENANWCSQCGKHWFPQKVKNGTTQSE